MKTNKNKNFNNALFFKYESLSKMDKEKLFGALKTKENGLSKEVAEERLEEFNKTHKIKSKKIEYFKIFFHAFINPFSLILIFIALMTFLTDIILASEAERSYFSLAVILTIVILGGTIRFVEEVKSFKDTSKLLSLVSNKTTVIRDGETFEIPLEEIVEGDILSLGSGDIIPSDLRIFESKDLFINESSLTGETDSIEKSVDYKETSQLIELNNIAFMGTNIVSGTLKAVVISKNEDTYFGSISAKNTKREKTSFEKGIDSVSKLLVIFMVILTPLVFVLNGVTKGDWLEAFIFSLTVSVGLTPELLPMIVTASLSRGSKNMAKEKVIIKNLNAINNFGGIDILCTDKTGTITENTSYLDKVIVLDNEFSELEIIKMAMLNASLQTGLKNNMDLAIINKFTAEFHENIEDLTSNFVKIDEIPFDFHRKRLSVIIKNKTSNRVKMITKGSAEEMIDISKYSLENGKKVKLDATRKKDLLRFIGNYNDNGYRVLVVAYKHVEERFDFKVSDEIGLTIIGLLAFIDPLKPSAKKTIEELRNYGVSTKILTGDNEKVARNIAKQLGIKEPKILSGSHLNNMDDLALKEIAPTIDIFAKLSPDQKERIIIALKSRGHKVGFMGDGINDALALKRSDIGISVNDATDIAKECADVILLENDLAVLEKGIIEGRKTHYNMMKYIKITASSNFGNMFSLLFAAIFLPFLPMLSVHVLILNLIYDITCSTLPFDNVDVELLKSPTKFDAKSIRKFMLIFGPISSIFDITTFLVLFYLIVPTAFGGSFESVQNKELFMATFQTGWFVESLFTQALVVLSLRSNKSLFKSKPNLIVAGSFILSILIVVILIFTPVADYFTLNDLPYYFFIYLAIVVVFYLLLTGFVKKFFIKRYKNIL